jgi:hypothetical protein
MNKELYDFIDKYMKENNISKLDIKANRSITKETLNLITNYENN